MAGALVRLGAALALALGVWAQAAAQETALSFAEIEARAEAGEAAAQFALGEAYQLGIGRPPDFAAAAAWMQKAAEQGLAEAEHRMGSYFRSGIGVEPDPEAAFSWFERAAAKGDPAHLYDLALMHEFGLGTPADAARAAEIYRAAADAGHVEAQVSLALLYQEGRGVTQDPEAARALYEGPAAAGNARAQNNLGLLYVRGEGVAQDYSKAAEWFAKAADQGFSQAAYNLGVLYDNGFGVPLDEARAVELYRQAGRTGEGGGAAPEAFPHALFDSRLAPPPTDPAERAALIQAAQAGDPVAEFLAGYLFLTADPPDAVAAAPWLRRAADKGHLAAMANLGLLHLEGRGLIRDFVQAYAWLALASAGGLAEALPLRNAAAERMTPGQLAEAQAMVQSVWEARQAAEQP